MKRATKKTSRKAAKALKKTMDVAWASAHVRPIQIMAMRRAVCPHQIANSRISRKAAKALKKTTLRRATKIQNQKSNVT